MLDPPDPPARRTPGAASQEPSDARRGGVTRRWLVAYRELVALRGAQRGSSTAARPVKASDDAALEQRVPGRRSPG